MTSRDTAPSGGEFKLNASATKGSVAARCARQFGTAASQILGLEADWKRPSKFDHVLPSGRKTG
jgi:hypothetical protein